MRNVVCTKIDALNNAKLSPQASKGNIRYLDLLSAEFTAEEFQNLRQANNESTVVKTIIWRWKKEGLVEKIDTNLWRKTIKNQNYAEEE